MCGIIGYVGNDAATPILLEGLKLLEYRGYDSAGIAVFSDDGIVIHRTEGKLNQLEIRLSQQSINGSLGIGHTRWATHGSPSEVNAHPHRSGDVVVVHNGIIENYNAVKAMLMDEGRVFSSETDTEVISQLVDFYYQMNNNDILSAIYRASDELSGSYALVIMDTHDANTLYVVKHGSPLVVGETDDAKFVASDIPAILPYTKDMIFLEDGDVAIIKKQSISFLDEKKNGIVRKKQNIPWNPIMAEKGGYKHFMLKEIFEQPTILQDVLTGRISSERNAVVLEELNCLFDGNTPYFDQIVITACGTSWHAGVVGKYMIENLARMPVTVDYASEFRYRDPMITDRTLVIPISQSGETADTLAAERLAKDLGAPVMAVCNVLGSSIPRVADATLYIHAGPEIGVASTKAFTAQLVTLYLFALYLSSKTGHMQSEILTERISELLTLPRLVHTCLESSEKIQKIAEDISDADNMLYIGRGLNYPVALEGALKLKEISYVHAEGFPAGELKHGPIALIDNGLPVIAIVPQDGTYEKVLSNLEEVKARGALVIAVASMTDTMIGSKVKDVLAIPKVSKFLTPILASIPLQLLAYYVADHKGTDVDQPRNLAKSVTVE